MLGQVCSRGFTVNVYMGIVWKERSVKRSILVQNQLEVDVISR